jgi:hypothetical protein
MADLCDVETALVAAILAAGAAGQGVFPLLGGFAVRVYRGTAEVTALTQDAGSAIVDVSVFPVPGATRNTTRWGYLMATSSVAAGLSVVTSGQTATFSGVAVAGELAGVLVTGQPYVYQAQAGDNADLVASALGTDVRATQVAWVQGSILTVPGAVTFVARTAGIATLFEETGRQEQEFRISVFAPSPAARDAVCRALGSALSSIAFLTLADGTSGRLRYHETASFDGDQVASIYRRDLIFQVEYGTTATLVTPQMLFGDLIYNGASIYV